MARTKTVNGRRVGISAKFSEAEAAGIDAARGATSRGVWLREVALAALGGVSAPPGAADGPVPVVRCAHPKARVIKGLCGACGMNVGAVS